MKSRDQQIQDIFNSGKYYCTKSGTIWSRARSKKIKRKLSLDQSGYNILSIMDLNSKQLSVRVHILIWIYFNGLIPKGLQINHKNGIKTDNRLENLELATHKENIKHSWKIGLREKCHGSKNHFSTIDEKTVNEIREWYDEGCSPTKIAKKYDVSIQLVINVGLRKTWKHSQKEY